MKKKLVSLLERSAPGARLAQDASYRAAVFAAFGLCVNLAYAVFNGVYGFMGGSYWFITLFAYYASLAVMRFYTVTFALRGGKRRTERSVMAFCGGWLCFLAVVVAGVTCLTIATARDDARPMIVMLALAAYTFWKAVMAIVNIVRARKKKQPLLITLRNIGCADAAMSMLILEHAMLSTFGDGTSGFARTMDAAVGAGVFLIVLTLGVGLLLESRKISTQ